jgi:hypothetical protein
MKTALRNVTILLTLTLGCGTGIGAPSAADICRDAGFSSAEITALVTLLESDRDAGISKREQLAVLVVTCQDVPFPGCLPCGTALIDAVYGD